MAGSETFLASPIEWAVRATGTHVQVTASKSAPGAGFRHYVFGVSISASAAPVAPAEAQVQKDGSSTVLDGFMLPAAAFAPIVINYTTHPLESSDNDTMALVIPDLGAGVSSVAVLKGTTRNRG